jgi:hypothetical protein
MTFACCLPALLSFYIRWLSAANAGLEYVIYWHGNIIFFLGDVMERVKTTLILIFLGAIFLTIGSDPVLGYPPFLKQVQELGYDAKNCTFCHQTPKGGKGWNERGLWLKAQKKERKAPIVDVKWLKEYKSQSEAETK